MNETIPFQHQIRWDQRTVEEDEAPRTEIATMEATMTGDGTGGDLGAEVQGGYL